MPICILLAPEGIDEQTRETMMSSVTGHIHEAYPNTVTEVFVQEVGRTRVMVDGTLLSASSRGNPTAREVRQCTVICPPGVGAGARKTMMENVTADIAEAYPEAGDIWVVHREHDPASAMLNGMLMTEKYG